MLTLNSGPQVAYDSARELRAAGEFTLHHWTDWTDLGGGYYKRGALRAAPSGKVHTIEVPIDAVDRYVWIACDVLSDDCAYKVGATTYTADASWYLSARLVFKHNQATLCEYPLSNGGQVVPGQVLNIFAPKTGAGMQPPLVVAGAHLSLMTYVSDDVYPIVTRTYAHTKLDAPCFFFRCNCTTIEYWVDAAAYGNPANPATEWWKYTELVTGLAVLSMYPN